MQTICNASIHRSSTQSGLTEPGEIDIPNPGHKHGSTCPWAASPPSRNFYSLQAFGMLQRRQAITFMLPMISAHVPAAPGFQAFVSERKLTQHLLLRFESSLVPRPVPMPAH